MWPVLIFDLDDTLYPEHTYVESGFDAVATRLSSKFQWRHSELISEMIEGLNERGRGDIFDELLRRRGKYSKREVRECLKCYRFHRPRLALYPAARDLLESYPGALYLVTDGHKVTQYNKIQALGLESRFKHCFITHRYGLTSAKPSLHCFELILKRERCCWNDIAYVGDNPAKDFVNLNKTGATTIRLLQGRHRKDHAKPGFDASLTFDDINSFADTIASIQDKVS